MKSSKVVENQFTQCLMKILKLVNDYKEHIPSITTTEGNPFPYQIAVQSQSESWSAMIKRMQVLDAPTIEKSSGGNPILPTATKSNTQISSRPNSINSDRRMS